MRPSLLDTLMGNVQVTSPVGKLNPLLRLAAISGVETAIKLHIRRGDDLDARDGVGATPLILAAARKRKGAVRLLLDAGANPLLTDSGGMDALAHARVGGCAETIALLSDALAKIAVSTAEVPDIVVVEGSESVVSFEAESLSVMSELHSDSRGVEVQHRYEIATEIPLINEIREVPPAIFTRMLAETPPSPPEDHEPRTILLDEDPFGVDFADDWEAEEDSVAPEGDETVVEASRQVFESIASHKIIDRDEDWGDVDLHLPARAAPLERDEGDGAVRALLLAALREGMISEGELIEVCANADGTRNEDAERLLTVVAGELGATVVEWTGEYGAFAREASVEEERLLNEATEFAEELASGRNDPFRFYSKDIRGDLLDAAEEISLCREMEEAGRDALAALARWPEGLAALFGAAERVGRGEVAEATFTMGPESSSGDELTSGEEVPDEEGEDSGFEGVASFFISAVAAVCNAKGDEMRVAQALAEVRLTRRFLHELAGTAETVGAGRCFVEALGRQSAARERMILSNLRLALSIAKKHLWSGMPFDDLVQEANIGLMKAVERYDWRRGFRFSTYATWWIRQRVTRSISDNARVVRAPVHVQETARRIRREREEVGGQLGRPETEVETAQRLDMPIGKLRSLLSLFDEPVSLDAIDSETGLSGVDVLMGPDADDPAKVAERASLHSTLMGMLAELDERARDVIVLRFGLGDEDSMTLEEVGQHFGVTRERIRQIEAKAMRRLSAEKRREILAPFLGDTCASRRPSLTTMAPLIPDVQDSVRDVVQVAFQSEISAIAAPSGSTGDLASRFVEEARRLGLRVHDRRSNGGELTIVAPYDSSHAVRAFGRRLIAHGFQKAQKDVFVL